MVTIGFPFRPRKRPQTKRDVERSRILSSGSASLAEMGNGSAGLRHSCLTNRQVERVRKAFKLFALFIIAVTLIARQTVAQSLTKSNRGFMSIQEKARVRAPEIKGGRGWLNTDKPLSIAALK